jgi:hypothetical protein
MFCHECDRVRLYESADKNLIKRISFFENIFGLTIGDHYDENPALTQFTKGYNVLKASPTDPEDAYGDPVFVNHW